MSVEHDDATTALVWPNGHAVFCDDLDELITDLKRQMMKVGTYEFYDYTIVSEERDISITEIQREFLSEDWSDELPPSYV